MDGSSTLISGIRFSSVVPAKATGENKDRDLTAIDLAMKLHYIRGVYFFRPSEKVRNLTIRDFKTPMFPLLALYYVVSGRIRRSSDNGDRPYIKCNDSGVRIVEAECEKSMEEWMSIGDDYSPRSSGLVYSQALGPDLGFSPLVFIQLTRFRCGGLAVGLSWAHVLGDFFSASAFMSTWGHFMTKDHLPLNTLYNPISPPFQSPHSPSRAPSSLKRVDPTGDLWIGSNDCKMATHSFRITDNHFPRIFTTLHRNQPLNFSHFEALSAIFWKSLSKIRANSRTDTISIYSTKCSNRIDEIPRNGMVLSAVEAGESADEGELARLIKEKKVEENGEIEELVEKENEESDFVAYGARLTFVNLEESEIYGLEFNGERPFYANFEVGGVGEDGVVLVLPGPPEDDGREGRDRTVTVIVPEKELVLLKDEMKKKWSIV